MKLYTTETVPGKQVKEALGMVSGNTIRTKFFVRDIFAGLKTIVGGELRGYTEMMTEARNQAIERMMKQAEELGADAVVGVRLGSSTIMGGAAEIVAFGTAVKLS